MLLVHNLLCLEPNIDNSQLKTIYLYNLLKNIEWGNSKDFSEYSILVISDDTNLKNDLLTLSAKKRVNNKSLNIEFDLKLENRDLKKYQLVLIDEKYKYFNSLILSKSNRKNILIVTFESNEKSYIMINFYYSKDNRLLFELNRANLLNNNLTASENIILLGGREIDVAEIYKNLQVSMQDLENSMKFMEDSIKKQEQDLAKKLKDNNELNLLLAKSKEESQKQQKIISEGKTTLLNQHKNFEKLKNEEKIEFEKQKTLLQNELQNKRVQLEQELKERERILTESLSVKEQALVNSKLEITTLVDVYETKQKYLQELDNKIIDVEMKLKEQDKSLQTAVTMNERLIVGLTIMLIFIIIITRNKRIIQDQKTQLEIKQNKLQISADSLKEANQYLNQSIEYASYIQQSIISDSAILSLFFSDNFIIWEPKDKVVGGDIFFFEQVSATEILIMLSDCTSHGIPGAFITILIKALEKQLINKIKYGRIKASSPADMLSYFNRELKHILKQFDNSSKSNVGFDGGIVYYNREYKVITYSGAQTPLYYLDGNEMKMTKYDRQSVGYSTSDGNYKFTNITFSAEFVTKIYISTDGYYDQVGGNERMMFGKKRLGRTLEQIQNLEFKTQKINLLDYLIKYQGNETRRDDITLIGLKI